MHSLTQNGYPEGRLRLSTADLTYKLAHEGLRRTENGDWPEERKGMSQKGCGCGEVEWRDGSIG